MSTMAFSTFMLSIIKQLLILEEYSVSGDIFDLAYEGPQDKGEINMDGKNGHGTHTVI